MPSGVSLVALLAVATWDAVLAGTMAVIISATASTVVQAQRSITQVMVLVDGALSRSDPVQVVNDLTTAGLPCRVIVLSGCTRAFVRAGAWGVVARGVAGHRGRSLLRDPESA